MLKECEKLGKETKGKKNSRRTTNDSQAEKQ